MLVHIANSMKFLPGQARGLGAGCLHDLFDFLGCFGPNQGRLDLWLEQAKLQGIRFEIVCSVLCPPPEFLGERNLGPLLARPGQGFLEVGSRLNPGQQSHCQR